MKSIIALALLLPIVLGNEYVDDLVFDDDIESSSVNIPEHHENVEKQMEKVKTTAGHYFELQIPSAASGENRDKVLRVGNNEGLPKWLGWDGNTTLLGVPSKKDIGQHNVSNLFTIEVTPETYEEIKQNNGEKPCSQSETLMIISLGAKFDDSKAIDKARALMNLAGVANLPRNVFSMHALDGKEECGPKDSKVIDKGSGNVKRRKGKHSCIRGQVGCDGAWWKAQKPFLEQIKEQNNALAEILQLPVLGWEVKADSSNFLRSRRETGSGDYGRNGDNDEDYDNENYDYDAYDDAEDNEGITESPKSFVPNVSEPGVFGEPTENQRSFQLENEHPHRHHHGEETIGIKAEENIDEDDIVPVIDPKLENIHNITSSSTAPDSRLTTTPQTTPETTLSTTLSTTMSTTPSTTIAQIVVSSTTPLVETTTGFQSTTNVASSPTTIETTKTDTVQETTVMTNKIDDGSENTFTIVTPTSENGTMSPTQLTTTSTTTLSNSIEVVTMSTEKQEINVTIDEISSSTESSTSSTQQSIMTSESTSKATTYLTTETQTEKSTTVPVIIPSSTTTTESTTVLTTTMSTSSSSPQTTSSTTSELPRISTIDFGTKNYAPKQGKRLKKVQVTAGKPLSFVIPSDTFSDIEDGDTRNLRLSLYYKGSPVKNTHWLQLNDQTQEIYGLPLEKDISIWDYELVASDREGLNVSERLDIHVQQHKQSRSANHKFSMVFRLEKRSNFPKNIDWELKIVQSLTQLYGDNNPNDITVRSIEIDQYQSDIGNFTWSNDSVPRVNECPKDEINKLLAVLIANQDGDPSAMLQGVLAPEIRVKRVELRGIHECEGINKVEIPKAPTPKPQFNEQPMPRNQVDQINATIGQLLVFQVPDDTFYDKEDGSARKLNMTLLTIDQTPILPSDWLQFDSKNQEFYGIPLQKDYEKNPRREYQLVVADKEGQTALDGLVVVIHVPTEKAHAVEFSMTLDVPYESFANSALKKRSFIEKLAELFHDKDTSMISLNSITPGSTVVTWRNISLPTDPCPNDEIARLMSVLSNPENGVSERVDTIMSSEFPVAQINRKPMGQCQDEMPNVHTPDSYVPPSGNSRSVNSSGRDDYLITFILPAIIIASMILLAGIIALVLYRRRRSGKMTVSEHDDERQSFRSKGIPVIFQDELEEKPDPGNKSPVILKEEKPPLPPPEYQKSDDGATEPMLPKENSEEPYQPPPPFARNSDNNRQNRPKPTPTYRKPPPYVPP